MDQMTNLCEKFTLIRGNIDISAVSILGTTEKYFICKDIDISEGKETYWYTLGGKGSEEMIYETIRECEFEVDEEGSYNFSALLSYESGERDDYGRYTMRPHMVIEHIELDFECTFQQRDRERKLESLFPFPDFDEIFKS